MTSSPFDGVRLTDGVSWADVGFVEKWSGPRYTKENAVRWLELQLLMFVQFGRDWLVRLFEGV